MEKREMTNSSGTCNLTPLSWHHLTGVDSEWEGSPAFHTAAETETQGGSLSISGLGLRTMYFEFQAKIGL